MTGRTEIGKCEGGSNVLKWTNLMVSLLVQVGFTKPGQCLSVKREVDERSEVLLASKCEWG